MPVFTSYNPATHNLSDLVAALVHAGSGLQIIPNSITLAYGTTQYRAGGQVSSLSFYDGSVAALGIGPGLLLTSGDGIPPLQNTQNSYGEELKPSASDAQLSHTVINVFPDAGDVQDVTSLQFQFTLQQGSGIRFDLVFGSDEYPEYSDTYFVDIAAIYVNGVNYALFNGKPNQPLSVLSQNLAAGNFIDNTKGVLPIEYDGVSNKLTIIAPAQAGVNTLKFAIGDTGDPIYDSGLFISNLHSVDYTGAGLAIHITGGEKNDLVPGNDYNEVFDLGEGSDMVLFGLGDDVFLGGLGNDVAIIPWLFDPQYLIPTSSGYLLQGGEYGNKTLVGVEKLYSQADNSLFALDTQPGGNTWFVYAMVNALTNGAPSTSLLSQWVSQADKLSSFSVLAQQVLDYYAPGLDPAVLVNVLYQNLVGVTPTADQVSEIVSLIGPGKTFATPGELLAFAVQLDINTQEIASIVGKPLPLELQYFI